MWMTLYVADSAFPKAVERMYLDVDALEKYFLENGIKAYTNKTKVIVFGSPQGLKDQPIF